MKFNICTASDSYKMGHYSQYPENTEEVYSYFESRKGAKYPKTMFFGLQYLLKEFFTGRVVTREKIDIAQKRVDAHLFPGAFNIEGWEYILKEYDGKLPVEIKAVPEGLLIDNSNVLLTVRNTDPKCYWLTNYLETILSHVWYSSTVATMSYFAKQMIENFLKETSDNPEAVDFMLHDFGARSVTSFMSSGIGGAGHLINFMGTDTFSAVETTMDYYNANEVTGFSVSASEHSVMTARGREGEMDVVEQLLDNNPTGILSVVIDSYDYRAFITEVAKRFKDKILSRDGKLVFRPDSGHPSEVTVECYNLLKENFGTDVNSKGYETLNPKVGLLWGDGIDVKGIESILFTLKCRGISACNMVFGMGGGLLQNINRDTQRCAFKSSYQIRNGIGYEIYKQPIDTSKTSKKGKFILTKEDNESFKTINYLTSDTDDKNDILETVFLNGKLMRDMTFEEVRNNANK